MKKILLNSSIFLTALLCFALTTNKTKAQTITLGTGTVQNTTSGYPAPYGNWYWGARHQFLVTKIELDNALANIASINSVGFDVVQAEGQPLQDFEIKIGHTTLNDLTSWQTGLTSVYGPVTYTETNGWNNHIFNSSFSWNGTDNVVIEVCFNNIGFSGNAIVNQSATSNNSSYYYVEDAVGVCSNNNFDDNPQQRPNLRMNVQQSVPVDLAMLSVDSVFNGSQCGLTNAETVYSAAKFTGEDSLLPGDTVFFSYKLDNQTVVTEFEVLVDTLFTGDTLPHTFTQTVDVSAFTSYELTNWITNSKDTIPTNDTLVSNFNNTLLVNSFPYTEDFEADNGEWSVSGTNSSWVWGTPNNTLITNPPCGNNAWTTNLTGNYNIDELSYLESPCFDFSGFSKDPIIAFNHIYQTESGFDNGRIEISIDGGQNWTQLGTTNSGTNWYNFTGGWDGSSTTNSGEWELAQHMLTGTAGQSDVRIRHVMNADDIIHFEGFGFDNVYIDTIAVNAAATALINPTGSACGLTANDTITMEFINLGSDTLFSIELCYIINNGTPVCETVNDTFIPNSNYEYTFASTANLSAIGNYDFKVYTNLTGDISTCLDTIQATVINKPVITSYPYFEDFESGKGFWNIGAGSVNSTWAFGTPNKTEIIGAASGDSAWVTGGLGTGFYLDDDNSWIVGPCFDFTNVDSTHWIGLKAWWDTENSWDGAVLQSSIDGGATWQKVGADGDPNNWFNDNSILGLNYSGTQEGWTGDQGNNGSQMWVQTKHTLDGTGLAGQPEVRFRIAFGSDAPFFTPEWDGFAFDDFAIGIPTQIAIVQDDDTACAGLPYQISGNLGFGSYLWSTGATTQTTSVSDTGTHVVSVMYTDTLGFCTTDTVAIRLNPSTPLAILGPDTTICGPYELDGNNFYVTHNWNTGETTPTITVPEDTSGLFIVIAQDGINNCFIDSANVTTLPVPVLDLGPNFTVCNNGGVAALNAGSGYESYQWSTGDTTQNALVNPIDDSTTTFYVTVTNIEGCEGVDSVKITSEDCTGIIELGSGSNLSVFPNPAKDVITVNINGLNEEFNLSLVDAQGRIIFAEKVNNGDKYIKEFSLAEYANGIYYFKLQTSDKVITEKVILQH